MYDYLGKNFIKSFTDNIIDSKINELTPKNVKKKVLKLKNNKKKSVKKVPLFSMTPTRIENKLEKIKIISKGSMSYLLSKTTL